METRLFPYTRDGVYGKFFEGASTVNFTDTFVVVEFEELKERKDLQSVIIQMVIVNMSNVMFLGDRKTPVSSKDDINQTEIVPKGHVAVLGDHPRSYDSRYASFGFIPLKNIRGKAWRIF